MGIYVGAKVFLIYEVRPGSIRAPHWRAGCRGEAGGWRGDTCPATQWSLVIVQPKAQAQREGRVMWSCEHDGWGGALASSLGVSEEPGPQSGSPSG